MSESISAWSRSVRFEVLGDDEAGGGEDGEG